MESILKTQPDLYRLYELLCSLVRSETEGNVVNVLRESSESVTVESLLLISVLFHHLYASGDRRGSFLLHHIFELFLNTLKVAQKNEDNVQSTIDALASDAFHSESRVEQVRFKDSVAYVAAHSAKRDALQVEAFIFGWLATWCVSGRPKVDDPQEVFAMLSEIDDQGAFALFKSNAIPRVGAVGILARSFLRGGGPKIIANRFLSLVLLLSPLFILVGAYILISSYWSYMPESLGLWRYAVTLVVFLGISLILLLLTAFIRYLSDKRAGVQGITVGSGNSARVLLDPDLPLDKFQKTVGHETMHMLKELGYIKRDLATLWEAHSEWLERSFDRDSASVFEKGFSKASEQRDICEAIDNYLDLHDSSTGELVIDYTMGYYVLGLIVKLCEEEPDRVSDYIRLIVQGHSAEYAFQHVCCS